MRVCIVVWNSVWFDPRVRKQIKEYLNSAVDVVCVGRKCSRYNQEKVEEIPCSTKIVDFDVRMAYKRSPIKKLKREYMKDQAICEAIIAYKPDVIHANDFDTLVACVKAAKILGCKVIYDSHEVYVENHQMKGLYKLYAAYMENRYVRHIDQMVCVSHAAADYFAKRYGIEKPMVVTNCSLKAEQCFSDEKNEGFEILNHGMFYSGRGYDIMAEAIPYLKDYPEIKLALRGFGSMEESLRARVQELGGENFRFYPKALVQELIPMAAKSHVGVAITEPICLNFELSVSNKLFEYASAGLPVIMSDIPEHRYLNEKYNFGVIIPENTPEVFAKAAIKLYTDKDFYRTCAENARKLSEEVNWESEFRRLIDLERRLTAGTGK